MDADTETVVEPKYTVDDMAQLLNTVVAGIRTGDEGDDVVYTLEEVAARTKFSLIELQRDCRSGLIEHTHRGRLRGMTSRQIALLVHRHRDGGDLAKAPTPANEYEAALQESRKALRSGRRRRGAAA